MLSEFHDETMWKECRDKSLWFQEMVPSKIKLTDLLYVCTVLNHHHILWLKRLTTIVDL